jgi:hypothetical protein
LTLKPLANAPVLVFSAFNRFCIFFAFWTNHDSHS